MDLIKACQIDSRWDDAIDFAEAELATVTKRRSQLQMAIRMLRRNRDDGMPWPSGTTDGRDPSLNHSIQDHFNQ